MRRRVGCDACVVLAMLAIICASGAEAAPVFTSWESSGGKTQNKDSSQDIMFLVEAEDSLTFSVATAGPAEVAWLVNKAPQPGNDASFAWTVPQAGGIWEIRVEASDATGMAAREWVVSTLNGSEAPAIFDYFSDLALTARTETDPWGRPPLSWTIGELDRVSNGYLESGSAKTVVQKSSDIAYGTWKFRYVFPDTIGKWAHSYLYFTFLSGEINGQPYYQERRECSDTHHHQLIQHSGYEAFSIDYDGGGMIQDEKWHEITVVRARDGWTYHFKDGMLDCYVHDDVPGENERIKIILEDGLTRYLDNLEVYDNRFLFPESGTVYTDYVFNYSRQGNAWRPEFRKGIVIFNRNVRLSDIDRAINDASLFSYDPLTRTATSYADLVLFDGAELVIENETLKFHSEANGERHFAPKSGSTLRVQNGVITSTNDFYFVWNNAGSTTHYGHEVSLWSRYGTYYESGPGLGNTKNNPVGTISNPWPNQEGSYARFIIDNSVINNAAHIFFDAPYQLNITNTQISNLHEVDIGNYDGIGEPDDGWEVERVFAGGDKGFWVYYHDLNVHDFRLKNVAISGAKPLNLTFMVNSHRDKMNIYDMDLEKQNVIIRKSLPLTYGQSHTCYEDGPPYDWYDRYRRGEGPLFVDSKLGLVNTRFNSISVPTDQAWVVPKYYLDVQVVKDGKPVPGATVTVGNEVDADFPAENMEVARPYPTVPFECVYHHYRFVDGQPLISSATGADGHTPVPPSDGANTFVVADYVQGDSGRTEFSYAIEAAAGEFACQSKGVDPHPGWYRPDPGVPTCTVKITLANPCPPAEVSCQQYGTIAGTVRAAGAAVEEATVGDGTTSGTTGASGTYRLSPLAAGHFAVTAAKAGYGSQTKEVDVALGQLVTLDFELVPLVEEDGGGDDGGDGDSGNGQEAGMDGGEWQADPSGDGTSRPGAVSGGCGCTEEAFSGGTAWAMLVVFSVRLLSRYRRSEQRACRGSDRNSAWMPEHIDDKPSFAPGRGFRRGK